MKSHIMLSLCAVAALTACTSSETRKQVSGNLDYLEVETAEALKVPSDLQPPSMSNRYELPQLQSELNIKGTEISIASPRLVLPLVNGSHVEEGSAGAEVLFDQLNDNEPLSKTIWDTVLSYLELNEVSVESFDQQKNELYTGWVVTQEELESNWYEFGSEFTENAKRFKLSLELAPHGRTAALKAELVEFIDADGSSLLPQLSVFEERAERVDFLNNIIAEYDVGIRLEQSQRLALIRDGFSSKLGFNPNGDPAFVVDAAYENAWPRLLLVLRKMGFDVIDMDQSSGLMFVKYNGQEESWWSGFFSEEELQLEKVNYRLAIESVGEQTAITFKDSENVPFDAQTVTDLFEPFADYMAQENLDI
ncbi:outer membrane protein assembly factor BamC [Glaciecola sp. XM2]|uniref:outer membrane protein assembly factor BamC n=1 Tax=Glaciecola sp. XM2 TaxID=1914931 RepID=UPI001BDE1900|nr:outer membrane protein assembly factor BamC [Glaciecola sp. XM2]MBT1449594.1 outer membrane protein assembly factor BamC [Glaciecola sp. XM2]